MTAFSLLANNKNYTLLWKIILIALLVVCAFNGVALADTDKQKTILVGSELDYPPYALVNEDGEADGFSIDLIKAVVEVMGIDITIHVAPWNEIKTHLERGEIDLLPHVYYSQERDRLFDFSVTHTSADAVMFVRKGDRRNLSVNDLRQKTVIAMQSDWTHEYLVANDLIDRAVLVNTVSDALRLLSSGEHDVAFLPHLVGQLLIRELKLTNIEIAGDLIPVGRGFAFAVGEGDFELLRRLNEGLAIIKAGGRYDKIYEKWFGVIDPKGVSRSTVIRYTVWTGAGVVILITLIFIWITVLRRTVTQQTTELRLAHDDLELRVKERTKELWESEKSLSNAQRIAHLGNWDWNVKTGELLWSDEIYRIFGQEPQNFKVTYDIFLEIVHPDDRQAVITAVEKALRNEAPYAIDHRIVLPDGSVRNVHESGEVTFDKSGAPLRMMGAVHDITEHKLAEHVLRKLVEGTSETTGMDFFHNLVQHLAESLGVDYAFVGELPSDAPGHVRTTAVWAKGQASENIEYELSGTPCENVVGKEMRYFSDHVQQLFPTDHLLVDMGVESYAGAPIFARDGTALGLLVVLHGKSMLNTELVKSMLKIFAARAGSELDRKQTEAQLIQSSKMASLGELTTGIAHELNQPLNITHMAAEALLEMANDGDLSTDVLTSKLERILDQTDRASAIINHMRTYGRTDSGELEVVDLTAVIQGATGLVKEQMRLSEIVLTVDLPETCRKVMGQQLQLEQVILNLITNARDAIEANATDDNKLRRINISITDNPGSKEVSFTVCDTGCGVPDKIMDRIFEPFFTTKEVGKGTGLGLSISYGMIAEMGGHIEVANVDGGAGFTITLPALSEAPEQGTI